MNKNCFFQLFSSIAHAFRAWNTGGEGIHSPRLFYLVRHLFYDTSHLYAWNEIESRRQAMLRAPKLLHVVDYGTGQDRDELVMKIAAKSLMPAKEAQLLARLVNYMNGTEYIPDRQRALNIVELGTSLGITTAYLAKIDSRNQVISFEGSDAIADMAELNWKKLGLTNISMVRGNIDNTLYNYARTCDYPIDVAVLDANHTAQATLRYFSWLLPRMDTNGVMVLDDIRYSSDMYRAWQEITRHPQVTATMDLGQMGLVFFYPQVQQKTYFIRI